MADVTTTFAARDTGFAATMQRIQSRMSGFARQMTGVAAASAKMRSGFTGLTRSLIGLTAAYVGVSQAINAFNQATAMGGRLSDLATSTGESAGNLALLERAFDNSGVGAEKLLPSFSRMTEFIQQLGQKSANAVMTANQLGVTFEQLKSLSPAQQFQLLMQRINGLSTANERLTAAGDVFGNRLGGKLLPLAASFGEEIGTARSQLGSMVELLNKNAASMDELGDMIENSVTKKLTEMTFGFLSGVTGANDLVRALSQIDAAGIGLKMGEIFSGAMKAPEQAFLLMGETLLLGIVKAMNYLANATKFAAQTYFDALSKSSTWLGIAKLIEGVFFKVIDTITKMLLSAFKTALLEPLSYLTGGLLDPVIKQFEGLQSHVDGLAADTDARLAEGAAAVRDAVIESSQTIPRNDVDYFGEENQTAEVSALQNKLRDIGRAGNAVAAESSPKTTEPDSRTNNLAGLRAIYDEEAMKIRMSQTSPQDYHNRMVALDRDYKARLSQLTGGKATSLEGMYDMLNQTTTSDKDRRKASEDIDDDRDDLSAVDDKSRASESTLKLVAQYLEDLTEKLPQPVLV